MKYNGTGFEGLHPTNAELLLALDCEIDEQQVEATKEHVAGCALCRVQWDKLQATSELMAKHHAIFLQSQVPMRSEETDAFAAQLGKGSVAERKPVEVPAMMRSWQKLAIAGLVAAATILISVGIWFGSPSKPAPVVQQPPAQVAAVVTPKEAVAIPPAQVGSNPGGHKVGMKKQVAKPAIKKQTFFELPFSDASLPLEEATIVRVKLPAQSLRAAGVPVEEENANTMLQADLLLGMDGLPRGIRLVRSGSGMN